MRTSVEDVGPCRKIMHVSAAWDEVSSEYEELVKAYSAAVAIPGFRKGKAPAAVVEKRYEKRISDEAKDRLLPGFYRDAIKAEELAPVAVVGVDSVEFVKGGQFEFDVTVDVPPRFKLPKYAKFSLKDETSDVSDAKVDEAIDSVRRQFSRFEDVEGRPVQEGDLAKIDYRGQSDGVSLSELASDCSGLGDATDFWAMVGDPEFIPGVAKGIAGMRVGEEKQITTHFPDDFHVPAVAGRNAGYTVVVKALRARTLPEMDADFLKHFEVETAEALREKVAKDLGESSAAAERNRRREEISKFLLEKTTFDPPQSLVDQETRHVFYSMARSMMQQGLSHEAMEARREHITNEAGRLGRDRVRLTFILKAIAADQDISVSDGDVEVRLREMAQRYRMPVEKLKAQIDERNGMADLRDDALCDAAMERLLEIVRVK